ncbi:MAG: hypothetical protein ACOH2A_04915 [Sphingobacteriaceae bacterium]
MKKILMLLLGSGLFIQAAFAQNSRSFVARKAVSAGLELGIPANSIYNIGVGGSVKLELPIIAALSLTATAGYTQMYFKNALSGSTVSPKPDGFAPLKAGGKYYFSQGFYGEGELGAVFRTNHGSGSYFTYAPGVGFVFPINNHGAIDVGLRFEKWSGNHGYSALTQTGIRVAYKFGW